MEPVFAETSVSPSFRFATPHQRLHLRCLLLSGRLLGGRGCMHNKQRQGASVEHVFGHTPCDPALKSAASMGGEDHQVAGLVRSNPFPTCHLNDRVSHIVALLNRPAAKFSPQILGLSL